MIAWPTTSLQDRWCDAATHQCAQLEGACMWSAKFDMLMFKFETNIDGFFVLISGGGIKSWNPRFMHTSHCRCAKLSVAGALTHLWGGENNICHVVYAWEMLANDTCCCARVWVGPWLGPTLCDYIHDKGFAFNSHVWMHRTANLVINR